MNFNTPCDKACLYRVEGITYAAPLNEYDERCGEGRSELVTHKFEILKETPCGVWISYGCDKKFVNLNSVKQFASRTLEDANRQFIYRKRRQITILKSQSKQAEKYLRMAEGNLYELT